MRLTSKGRYAVITCWTLRSTPKRAWFRWLIFLNDKDPLYLEQLWSDCVKWTGFSVRGPCGGYLLGKDAGSIAVGEAISVDELLTRPCCRGKGGSLWRRRRA